VHTPIVTATGGAPHQLWSTTKMCASATDAANTMPIASTGAQHQAHRTASIVHAPTDPHTPSTIGTSKRTSAAHAEVAYVHTPTIAAANAHTHPLYIVQPMPTASRVV
jgi:hypothetical protein